MARCRRNPTPKLFWRLDEFLPIWRELVDDYAHYRVEFFTNIGIVTPCHVEWSTSVFENKYLLLDDGTRVRRLKPQPTFFGIEVGVWEGGMEADMHFGAFWRHIQDVIQKDGRDPLRYITSAILLRDFEVDDEDAPLHAIVDAKPRIRRRFGQPTLQFQTAPFTQDHLMHLLLSYIGEP